MHASLLSMSLLSVSLSPSLHTSHALSCLFLLAFLPRRRRLPCVTAPLDQVTLRLSTSFGPPHVARCHPVSAEFRDGPVSSAAKRPVWRGCCLYKEKRALLEVSCSHSPLKQLAQTGRSTRSRQGCPYQQEKQFPPPASQVFGKYAKRKSPLASFDITLASFLALCRQTKRPSLGPCYRLLDGGRLGWTMRLVVRL